MVVTMAKGPRLTCYTQESDTVDVGVKYSADLANSKLQRTVM